MNFVINRSTWRCGGDHPERHGEGDTQLLNEEGFMCCLGQVSVQLGVEKESLLYNGAPFRLGRENILACKVEDGWDDTALAVEAMSINDARISRDTRETKLSKLFQRYGHELTFEGEYVDQK